MQNMKMDCPPDWQDKSMLIFSAPRAGESGVTPNIVVTRDVVPPDLPPDQPRRMNAMIDRQIEQMKGQLAGFAVTSRRVDPRGGEVIAELKVDWHNAQATLSQSVTFLDNGTNELIVATATAGRGEFAAVEPLFHDILASFRIG